MSDKYRIFCDETCHLENDRQPYMVLGGLIVDETDYRQILEKIHEFRNIFKLGTEFKWTNISKSRINFYHAIIDLFVNEPGLGFRAVIVKKNAACTVGGLPTPSAIWQMRYFCYNIIENDCQEYNMKSEKNFSKKCFCREDTGFHKE